MNCLKKLSFGETKALENYWLWNSRYAYDFANSQAVSMEFPLHLTHRVIFLPDDFLYDNSSGLEASYIYNYYFYYYSLKRTFQLIVWKNLYPQVMVHFAVCWGKNAVNSNSPKLHSGLVLEPHHSFIEGYHIPCGYWS